MPKAINLQSKSTCRAVGEGLTLRLSAFLFVLKELQSSVFESDDQNTRALKELCHSSFFFLLSLEASFIEFPGCRNSSPALSPW